MGVTFMEEMTKEVHSASHKIRATIINGKKTSKSQELLGPPEPTDGVRFKANG